MSDFEAFTWTSSLKEELQNFCPIQNLMTVKDHFFRVSLIYGRINNSSIYTNNFRLKKMICLDYIFPCICVALKKKLGLLDKL